MNSIGDYKTAIEKNSRGYYYADEYDVIDYHSRIFIKKSKYDFLFNDEKKRLPRWLGYKGVVEYEHGNMMVVKYDSPSKSVISKSFLKKYAKSINFIRETPLVCKAQGDELLNKLLDKYLGKDIIIPFGLEARKKKFPLAFKELAGFMKKYL